MAADKRKKVKANKAPRSNRVTLAVAVVAVVAACATLVTAAILAPGYDAQQTPPEDTTVWVTRDTGQYARFDTSLGELDTVRSIDDPAGVVQFGPASVIYNQAFRQAFSIDGANPANLQAASEQRGSDDVEGVAGEETLAPSAQATPAGTREVVSAGNYVVYLTETGAVYLGHIDEDPAAFSVVDPFSSERSIDEPEQERYVADAVAVDADGNVAMYSAAEAAVRIYRAASSRFVDPVALVDPPATGEVRLTLVSGRFVLLEPATGRLWWGGGAPADTDLLEDAKLASSSTTATRALVADSQGLLALDLSSGEAVRVARATGTPAEPLVLGGIEYAAWLTADVGSLYSSVAGEVTSLVTDRVTLVAAGTLKPVFRSNGAVAVLQETATGSLWQLPDGKAVPLAQWSVNEQSSEPIDTVTIDDVAEQLPPVAKDDNFGVRAGAQVLLPLLFNDFDPNRKDVLTIAPDSLVVGPELARLGTVSLVADNQSATVMVAGDADGQATFSYQASDGTDTSNVATVTLRVVPPGQNEAPVWCGVPDCKQLWPTPQVSPGGTIIVPVLDGFVDPEGDAIFLSSAEPVDVGDPLSVIPMADGRVAIRHLNPDAAGATIPIRVVVSDVLGATTERILVLSVTGTPLLSATAAAVVSGVGQSVTVPIFSSIRGGSGSYNIVDVNASGSAADLVQVQSNGASGEVELLSETPGDYTVKYMVQDIVTGSEASGRIRLTVTGTEAPLAVAPMVAFVRANEDTTVAVLDAVQSTSGRVLSVSSVVVDTPALSADLVDRAYLRVSGRTLDGGPGLIGRASVTITDNAGAGAVGIVSVYLIEPSIGLRPVTVPDSVVVRVNELVDIPVLANDVSPRGERLGLHPELSLDEDAGLAFTSGGLVRYLAPNRPGTHTIEYTAYLENAPQQVDTSTVTVTVLPDGTNRKPRPPVLTGRTVSGGTVSIPLPRTGIDPDGDAVVLLAVSQPKTGEGVATLSARGDSIVYRAPATTVASGQVSFSYTVRDDFGATAEGTVRVGVEPASLSDPAPVAFSDYVRVQRGAVQPVTVRPLLNDRDPAGGDLELVSVVPNVPGGSTNPEYERQLGLIGEGTSLSDGVVALHAGNMLGPMSFIYTVASKASGSNAQGLIVVNVTAGQSPDAPVLADTVVTARNLGDLSQPAGLDVVTNKAQWISGDLAALQLSVWGPEASRFEVRGWSVTGDPPAEGALVPLRLAGEDADGTPVTTYAFLRIPAFDDMRLELRRDVTPVKVNEEGSKRFDVRDFVSYGSDFELEVRSDKSLRVQRPGSTCVSEGDGFATYTAAREAPWTDTCLVSVRLAGQDTWSPLAVPIEIAPKAPQAILSPVTRTIAPAARDVIDIYNSMVSWEGGRVGNLSDLDYRVTYSGVAFTVDVQDGSIRATAHADAAPGTRETVNVQVSSFGGLEAALTLVVGVASPDAPRGATLNKQCRTSEGTSCTLQLVGVAGEYDPFAGDTGGGLTLVAVGGGESLVCPVATASLLDGLNARISWGPGSKAEGGTCVVPFTVADAQGRTGRGELTVDLLGYPKPPLRIETRSYTADSVDLSVDLGEAANAHPTVNGVVLYGSDGTTVASQSCAPGQPGRYRCTVSGLVPGEPHTYTVRAVNEIGQSADSAPLTTWSYQAPKITITQATPVYVHGKTDTATGAVRVTVAFERGTERFSFAGVKAGPSEFVREGDSMTVTVLYGVGIREVTVTPISKFRPPAGSEDRTGASETAVVVVAGAPKLLSGLTATLLSNTSVSLGGPAVDSNGSTLPTEVRYLGWEQSQQAPSCSADPATGAVLVNAGDAAESNTGEFAGLSPFSRYRFIACFSNGYGAGTTPVLTVDTFDTIVAPEDGKSYRVATTAIETSPGIFDYDVVSLPTFTPPAGFKIQYRPASGVWQDAFPTLSAASSPLDADGHIDVRYCSADPQFATYCSTEHRFVTAASVPTIVKVTMPTSSCIDPETASGNDIVVSAAALGAAARTLTLDVDSNTATYRVSFTGAYSGLNQIEASYTLCAPPDDPDDPEGSDDVP